MTQSAQAKPQGPRRWKRWIAVPILLGTVLFYQSLQEPPLSPAEQAFTGEWKETFVKYHPVQPTGSPDSWTRFWTFHSDRTFTMGDSLAQPRLRGRWQVEGKQMILDFEQVTTSLALPIPHKTSSRSTTEFTELAPRKYQWKNYLVPGKAWHECLLTPFEETIDSRTGAPPAGVSTP